MKSLSRVLSAGLSACVLSLSGCHSDEPNPDPTPQQPTPLVERTDYVDVVPDVPCQDADFRAPRASCSGPSSFDLARCNLGTVSASGVYQVLMRYTATSVFGAGLLLPSGQHQLPGTFLGRPLNNVQVGSGFYVRTEYALSDGTQRAWALAGCRTPSPGHVTGCFVRCTNGVPDYSGTFDAQRMTWAEPQESSGLTLVSESPLLQTGDPVDVYVTKGRAYVVSVNRGSEAGGLTVFDVTDPAHPRLARFLNLPKDSYWNGVWAKGDALYIASASSGVLVYDISQPDAPQYVRALPGGALNAHTLYVDGDRLFAMSPAPTGETLLFDASSPLEPKLLSRIVVPHGEGSYPHDAFPYGDRLYVNHAQGGYVVVDLKRPEAPAVLGTYAFDGQYSHASAVATFGERTIAFEGGERPGAHLRVLDVTDPAHIKLLAEVKKRSTTSIHNMVLQGTRLYVAWYHEGVRVLDVADPVHPKEVAHFNTFQEDHLRTTDSLYQGAIGMRVPGDGYVYVVDLSRGLLVLREP